MCIYTYLVIFAVDEGQFETVLCGVDHESPRLCISVQAVDGGPSHQGDVDGQIKGPYDSIVTGGKKEEEAPVKPGNTEVMKVNGRKNIKRESLTVRQNKDARKLRGDRR